MTIVVTGGRDFSDWGRLNGVLSALHGKIPIGMLIHGGAAGADSLAHEWAQANNVSTFIFPADWKTHGLAAGPIRNQEMIDQKPDLVVAFPGSTGTRNCTALANRAGIPVFKG